MRLRAIIGLSAIAALLFAAVAWMRPGASATYGVSGLKVVATTSIIADWVHNVAGDTVEVTTLIGPDSDPHEYQPVPADSIALSQARLIFENGLGLENWLDKLYAAADSTATRIVLTDGVVPRSVPSDETQGKDRKGGDGANTNSNDRDPHAWQNVADAVVMVGNIRDALVMVDPAHADADKARAAAYIQQLQDLDAWIRAQISAIPPARRKLVTSHDAFGYFGDRYGIDVSRSALESVTTEAADPSARQMADMIDQIKAADVPVIFVENIENPRLINQIATEAHVQLGPPLYTDALGAPGTSGDTYLHMMRYNVETLVKALGQ